MIRTFEYDDYPTGAERMLSVLDKWKQMYPCFKCTVFAIPSMMTDSHWKPLLDRAEWIQVGIHGFEHVKGECRSDDVIEKHLPSLDACLADDRYSPIFKAPWYGYNQRMLFELAKRDVVIAINSLAGWPFPTPKEYTVWNRNDLMRSVPTSSILAHPVENNRGPAKKTGLSDFRVRKWQRQMSADDQWVLCTELARSALLKLNLGCEKDVWDGWVCMDKHPIKPEVVEWCFEDMLPFADCSVDVVLTSHTMNHLADEDYLPLFLEIWRVLRPNGVFRTHQDDADSGYVWRNIGSRGRVIRRIGAVKSISSKSNIIGKLEKVGFEVHESGPGVTLSVHEDVLQGDNRMTLYTRGHKFYAEAVKRIPADAHRNIRELMRADKRCTKAGRYKLAE